MGTSSLFKNLSDEAGSRPLPPVEIDGPGRARAVNGTISYMPPLFGLMLAGEVIRRLLQPPAAVDKPAPLTR